jgi:hypothetical protein
MKPEDLSADYSELTEWELKVLDDWLAYYTKVRFIEKNDERRNLAAAPSSFAFRFWELG